MRRSLLVLGLFLVALTAPNAWSGQAALSRGDADIFQRKLLTIAQNGTRPARDASRVTTVSEREINAYLRFLAAPDIPAGVVEPRLWILGDGRVAGQALVDLDAVRTQKARGWTDPAGYLTGRLPVQATGFLTTKNGIARFTLESADVSGVSVPKFVLQEIVAYYTRTPEQPNGIGLDDPFELPAGIREIQVGKGAARVVQ